MSPKNACIDKTQFYPYFLGLNDQDVISLGNHTEEAVKDKKRLFMYRVVAPQGLFPGILIDQNYDRGQYLGTG